MTTAAQKSVSPCDECREPRATLYERKRQLVCVGCLPVECLSGDGARRSIRNSVTGAQAVERRRRKMKGGE